MLLKVNDTTAVVQAAANSAHGRFRCFLFDLDGTLTDPAIGITNSVMYALDRFGIHVEDRSVLFPFIGPPLPDSFRKYYGFSEEQAAKAVEYYREFFRDRGIFENKVYEGIPEMLSALRRAGRCYYEKA